MSYYEGFQDLKNEESSSLFELDEPWSIENQFFNLLKPTSLGLQILNSNEQNSTTS